MKIVNIDTEDFVVFVEENGVIFPIYYAADVVLSFVEKQIKRNLELISSGIEFWVVYDPRDPFILGYDKLMKKDDSIDTLKEGVKEEYESFKSFGILPKKDTFSVPTKGAIEKYKIPEDKVEMDFYVFRLMNAVRNFISAQREDRETQGRYDNHRRNL